MMGDDDSSSVVCSIPCSWSTVNNQVRRVDRTFHESWKKALVKRMAILMMNTIMSLNNVDSSFVALVEITVVFFVLNFSLVVS